MDLFNKKALKNVTDNQAEIMGGISAAHYNIQNRFKEIYVSLILICFVLGAILSLVYQCRNMLYSLIEDK